MSEALITTTQYYTARAGLVALGSKLQNLNFFGPIKQQVKIQQKTVKYAPTDKLYDLFISLLAGAQGVVELNKRLRAEPALQKAFGRSACAEQSVVQDTLDACSAANVDQMQQAFRECYQHFSASYYHNYSQQWLVLDADFTGLVCGKTAQRATKGYFVEQPGQQGRQVGRVVASQYGEIVVERLYAGNYQLNQAFESLVWAAHQTLHLDRAKRGRVIWRADSGAGTVENVKFLLGQGYGYCGKAYGGPPAKALIQSVLEWYPDPKSPGRAVGRVTLAANPYGVALTRLIVRCQKKNGQWVNDLLLSNLSAATVLQLTGQPAALVENEEAILLAYLYFYDQRGGGVECEIKQDKQGLGLAHRNKKSFWGQAILVQLSALAHNALVWFKRQLLLNKQAEWLRGYGLLRLIRDVLTIGGLARFSEDEGERSGLISLSLNATDSLAKKLHPLLAHWLSSLRISCQLAGLG